MTTPKILGIEISNPKRIIYPKDNITKLDVIKYYARVAPKMLPFLEDKLLSVIRCHNSINDECFFKKHPTLTSPHIKLYKNSKETYFYITSQKGIITQAQNGTIEFHTGGSSVNNINKPTVMVFDLDPDENLPLENLRQGVIHLKQLLDQLNLKSYLKTSGGKGYHIVVPFSYSKNWESFSSFAKNVALVLESKYPKLYTTNIRKNQRNGKIFIDYLRNDKNSTCVAPYSLRARDNAPISMPISWQNLNKIAPNDVTIKNISKFLSLKDPWQDFYDTKQVIR